MNPLTNVKNITKLNETELSAGTTNKKSWHDIYKDSAWIFIGGLPYDLTEGDVLTVFSQYGEIININLVRDQKTGKTKGFGFLCYANQMSTRLAVDNFNGIKLCGRTIRVDHVANYKPPKEDERDDEITKMLKAEGCAPKAVKIEPTEEFSEKKKKKKVKKEKKKKNKKSDKREEVKVKIEKEDPGYDKYEYPNKSSELKEEHEHRNRKSDNKDCSNHTKSIKTTSDKDYKSNSYHYLKNKNSDSTSKYPSDRKRQNNDDSSSDSSSDTDNDDRKNSKKSSNQGLRTDFSYSAHNSERNKGTDIKYRHKTFSDDNTDYQKRDKSRERKDRHAENRHKSIRHNRHDSSLSCDEGRSSEQREKKTKKHYHEESPSSDKSSNSLSEKRKHRHHDSSKREEYYTHKKHKSK